MPGEEFLARIDIRIAQRAFLQPPLLDDVSTQPAETHYNPSQATGETVGDEALTGKEALRTDQRCARNNFPDNVV